MASCCLKTKFVNNLQAHSQINEGADYPSKNSTITSSGESVSFLNLGNVATLTTYTQNIDGICRMTITYCLSHLNPFGRAS